MSITLQNASGVNVIFDLTKSTGESNIFQNVGTSFLDTRTLVMNQKIARNGSEKVRESLKVPFTYTEGSVTKTAYMYAAIEATVPAEAPLVEVDKLVWLIKTLAAHAATLDLVKSRKQTA